MSIFTDRAKTVIDVEIKGLQMIRDHLDEKFDILVEKCAATVKKGGKLILTGIGKSGYIGQKIAATLSSVGSPAVFMHPVEALHGDLGIMQGNDLVLAISYSGETEELLSVLTPAKRLGMPIFAITGFPESSLAKLSDFTLPMTVGEEACPFNLAPTTTTTALLALGDALALVLLDNYGFTREDFGRLHPGGAIGRAVTMRAGDIMRSGSHFALVSPETPVREALFKMTQARCGAAVVVDGERRLAGIFTDGDFRRHAEQDINVLSKVIGAVMTTNPVAVKAEALAVEVLKLVEDRHINDVIVLDGDNRVTGMIDVQDLPGLKLM
ncbi:MAG: KpsF/GutQ family sugar-phosphate isomerase [Victivallaceae bacterium]|nr:KpsF/GutQ family sugar-phosphate isomerase [Victivallaceae bacterium]